MRYKNFKYLFRFLIIISSNTSCLNLQPCNKDIIGRYYCKNIKGAVNYLDLNKDGTFFHYFKKDTIVLEHWGNWKWTENGYCYIRLHEWKSFNELGLMYEDYGNGSLYVNGNYLDIGPDGESLTSFKKLE